MRAACVAALFLMTISLIFLHRSFHIFLRRFDEQFASILLGILPEKIKALLKERHRFTRFPTVHPNGLEPAF